MDNSEVFSYAALALVCDDCGAIEGRESHDDSCMTAWLIDMRILGEREGYVYTDDTTDMLDRGGVLRFFRPF